MAKRVDRLSAGDPAQQNLLCNRYRRACTHNYTIQQLESWNVQQQPAVPRIDENLTIVPIVIRYHPCFARALRRTCNRVPVPAELCVRLLPSWKNALPSLQGVVQKANKNSCEKGLDVGRDFVFCSQNLNNFKSHEFSFDSLIARFHV